jgi:hypothetical protein
VLSDFLIEAVETLVKFTAEKDFTDIVGSQF